MSYIYAHGKKMRKKSKAQQLTNELATLRIVCQRLAQAGQIISQTLEQFGKEDNWLAREDEVEGMITTDYIWHNGTNPVTIVKQAQDLARSVMGLPKTVEPSLNSEAEAGAEVSSDHTSDELPSAVEEGASPVA